MFGLFHFVRAQFPQVPIARTAKSALFNYLAASETDLRGLNRVRERVKRADLLLRYLAERGIYRHTEKPVYVPTHIAVDFIIDCEEAVGQKPFTPPRNFVKDEGVLTLKPDGDIGYARFRNHTVAYLYFYPDTRRFYHTETGAPPAPMPEETKLDFKTPKARIVFHMAVPKFGETYEEFRKQIDEEEAAAKARQTYEAKARAEYLSAISALDKARRKLRKIGRRPDISIDSSAGHVHCSGFLREETK